MPGSVHNAAHKGIIKPRSLSTIKTDYDSDDSDDEIKNCSFFVRRIVLCISSIGLMFMFGYLGMKWRRGEIDEVEKEEKITCNALEGTVTYPHYSIQIRHEQNIPHLHVKHLHQSRETILTLSGDVISNLTGSDPIVDHTQCSVGKFSTHLIGKYQISCNTITEGWHLWNYRLEDDTVVCRLEVNSNEDFAQFQINQTQSDPSCSLNRFTSYCIGNNISIATSTELNTVGPNDVNTSIIKLSTFPQGMYNRSNMYTLSDPPNMTISSPMLPEDVESLGHDDSAETKPLHCREDEQMSPVPTDDFEGIEGGSGSLIIRYNENALSFEPAIAVERSGIPFPGPCIQWLVEQNAVCDTAREDGLQVAVEFLDPRPDGGWIRFGYQDDNTLRYSCNGELRPEFKRVLVVPAGMEIYISFPDLERGVVMCSSHTVISTLKTLRSTFTEALIQHNLPDCDDDLIEFLCMPDVSTVFCTPRNSHKESPCEVKCGCSVM